MLCPKATFARKLQDLVQRGELLLNLSVLRLCFCPIFEQGANLTLQEARYHWELEVGMASKHLKPGPSE